MAMTSFFPYALFSALMIALGWVVVKSSKFYQNLTVLSQSNRFPCIDGLRGFLAFGVMVHHSICYYYLFQFGRWDSGTAFYGGLGTHGVSLFFMITGLLFWNKVMTNRGCLKLKPFFLARLRRIAPMYYFSAFIVLLLIGVRSRWQLQTSVHEFAHEILRILSGGWSGYGEINKSGNNILNGVYWTLKLEWRFYLALPFVAWLVYGRCILTALAVVGVFLLCQFVTREVCYFQFVLGAFAAEIVVRAKFVKYLQSRWASALALAALIFTFKVIGADYSWPQSLALFVFFVCVAAGNSLFGLLTLPGATFLGVISYSVYLIHMSLLFIGFSLLDQFYPVSTLGVWSCWALILGIGAWTLVTSALTYRFVEYRYMKAR